MAKLFGNLYLILALGLVAAIAAMVAFAPSAPVGVTSVLGWLHALVATLWLGLVFYLNVVQLPTMSSIPADLKQGVTGHIAPKVFFLLRWSALLTVVFGLGLAFQPVGGLPGYGAKALTFSGEGNVTMIGLGMWLGIIMALNVWLVIWPAQKKILGIVEATDAEKAAATPRALIASRANLLLSLPMLYCMVSANLG